MKKIISAVFALIFIFSLSACSKNENPTTKELTAGTEEMIMSGKVEDVSGTFITLSQEDNYEWNWNGGDKVTFSINAPVYDSKGALMSDISADDLKDNYISVICNNMVNETYPGQLTGVREIILIGDKKI